MKQDDIDTLLPILGIALAVALAGWGLYGAASFLGQFYNSIFLPSIRFADVLIANYGRGIAESTVLISLGGLALRFWSKQSETLAAEFSKATQTIVAENQRLNEKVESKDRIITQFESERWKLTNEVDSLTNSIKAMQQANAGLQAEIENLKHPERLEQARLEEEQRAVTERIKAYAANAEWGGV